jgi:hypothetical protein
MTIIDPEARHEQQPQTHEPSDEPLDHLCDIKAPRHARLEETSARLFKIIAKSQEVPFGD